MKTVAVPLGILTNNIESTLPELFRYMITEARIVMATKWKAEKCPVSNN